MTSMYSKIIETQMVREITSQTLDFHSNGGGIFIWYGAPTIGKTVTAQHLIEKINRPAGDFPGEAVHAAHYHVGEIPAGTRNIMKKSIHSLYEGVLKRPLDRAIYAGSTTEGLAIMTVQALRVNKIEMVLVDDADFLSLEAIRAMIFVHNVTKSSGSKFSLVFIGTESLPKTIMRNPSLSKRVTDWSYFEEYGLDETWEILQGIHPHFRSLDRRNKQHVNQVKFIHEMIGGDPGPLVSFLRRLDYYSKLRRGIVDETFLRAVYFISERDRGRSFGKALTVRRS